jgi:AAA family ATP:ADP antiporter
MNLEQIFLTTLGVVLTLMVLAGILAARGNAGALALIRRVVDVRPDEVSAMLLSAFYFFFTLTSYSMLRPVRDEFAAASGVRELPKLFLATLITMLVVTPIYGALVSRVPVRKMVRVVYQTIAACLVGFFFLLETKTAPVATQWAFFAWLSVYALFGPSLFWSVMADTYSSMQAKRLFGFIGVGGTIGFITGLSITGFFTSKLGQPQLLLIAAVFVLIAATIAGMVPRIAPSTDTLASEKKHDAVIGGSAIAGALHVLKSPYLATIAAFLFLYVFGSTILYSAQTDIAGQAFADRAERTEFLARIELAVQIITAFGQMFITARLMRNVGLGFTLSAVPIVSVLGFAALALTPYTALPLLGTFVVIYMARRASEYMLTQPSRKVLFTVLAREDKYKTTNFLETFVYRGGDQLSIWMIAGLATAGLAITSIAWFGVVVGVVSIVTAVWLARRQKELAVKQDAEEAGAP